MSEETKWTRKRIFFYRVKYYCGSVLLLPVALVLNVLRWVFGK